ncbi:acyltransferase domain-containing protein [Planomonospora sp. ID91781]|uniref:type I polyketide synthase n=1 Tax=Planomonospora sp. ID91781 TaxID=2738135 RepID=UPI0018C3D35B|nr:acyltransferase domain-containing protein [Planomonospora sp. ID91781]
MAFEVALFRLLESWGVRPDVLVGHSVGELAAAHVAGVLDLADVVRLVVARGRLMQALPAGGVMVAVQASEAEVAPLLTAGVGVAAVNGPSSVVVSGERAGVEAVVAALPGGRRWSRLRVSHAFHSPLMEPVLEEFRRVAESVTYRQPDVSGPVAVSTVTGAPVAGEWGSAEYWVEHVRRSVRFADAVDAARGLGVSRWVEVGPDAVLTALAVQTLTADSAVGADSAVVGLQRRGRGEVEALLTGLGQAYAHGVTVDWARYFSGSGARRVELPTYAFQRKPYWLRARAGTGDVSAAGLAAADHPLLGAVVSLPDAEGVVLTGRLTADGDSWLGDHDLWDVPVLPAAALTELALHAGEQVDCPTLRDLTVDTPLVLPEQGALVLRVVVGGPAPDEAGTPGARRLDISSRPETGDASWTRHATGTLARTAVREEPGPVEWPPAGATVLDVSGAYAELLERGHGHGAVFQGLRAAWWRGDEIFAEVALPEEAAGEGFLLHPALLDAATHAYLLHGDRAGSPGRVSIPAEWEQVTVHAPGIVEARVRVAPGADGRVTMTLTDVADRPVLTVGSLRFRQISRDLLPVTGGARPEALYRLDWVQAPSISSSDAAVAVLGSGDAEGYGWPVHSGLEALNDAIRAGAPVPGVVLFPCPARNPEIPSQADAPVAEVLELARSWPEQERLASAKLVVLTSGAVAAGGIPADLAQAPVAGLVRAAAAEHPGRFALVDLDGSAEPRRVLAAALAADEDEVAVRGGTVLVPRLVGTGGTGGTSGIGGTGGNGTAGSAPDLAGGTVLVTGDTEGVGALLARHLVARHGVRHLLLAGAEEPRADVLDELAALGAEVTTASADPDVLSGLLADIPPERPLTAVVHVAGAGDNGLLGALTGERLADTLRRGADPAWHLHRMTGGSELSAFVLVSSSAGLVYGTGQATEAAASVYLDALAGHRRSQGMPGTSLALGPWTATADPDGALLRRMERLGMPAISEAGGLDLFDAALGAGEAAVLGARFDRHALRAIGEDLPAVLRDVARVPARRSPGGGRELRERLAGLPEAERLRLLLDVVRTHAAAVLGHASADEVGPDRAYQELGFDSLAAVELRKRLGTATGAVLPATLVFDFPTSRTTAEFIAAELAPAAADPVRPVLDEVGRLEKVLAAVPRDGESHDRITARLEALLRGWYDAQAGPAQEPAGQDYGTATDDELFKVLDDELGIA